jgi:hypothetical protein
MEKIAVCVSPAKLLASLRCAFTNKYTVVSELMQNARRAKASFVAIDYDGKAQSLTVRDDGVGITDWQKLFTVGESGWDTTTARDEHAFGVGFMKSLYSARRCTVRSRDRMIAFDTAEALRQADIEVQAAMAITETVVRLEGVVLEELDRHMDRLASAFPIPVIYNGVRLARPLASDARTFVATDIGDVYLVGTDDGKATTSTLLVLQGLVVSGDPQFDWEGNIVHLDPRRFLARLPDRDVLIDEDDVVKQVDAVLKALWRTRLLEARQTRPSDVFVGQFFDAAVRWGATDLFADVPLLPGRLFARVVGYPIQEGYAQARYLEALPGLVRWQQFRQGLLKPVALPTTEAENFPYWMFAKAKGLVVFTHRWGVADNHWIWEYVLPLAEDAAQVEIVNERLRSTLAGQWIAPEVVLCEAYRIRVNGEIAELTDEAMYWTGQQGDEELILVPDGERGGDAVEQCSSYLDDDDRWRGQSAQADRGALAALVRQLRTSDPTEALRSLIEELRLERYPGLHGHTFSVQVGSAPNAHEVRLVA